MSGSTIELEKIVCLHDDKNKMLKLSNGGYYCEKCNIGFLSCPHTCGTTSSVETKQMPQCIIPIVGGPSMIVQNTSYEQNHLILNLMIFCLLVLI